MSQIEKYLLEQVKLYTRSFTLWPMRWREYLTKTQYNFKWKKYAFTKRSVDNIPREYGVYTFVLKPNIANHCSAYLMYIGKAKNETLYERIKYYFAEKDKMTGRPKVKTFLNIYDPQYIYIYCAILKNRSRIDKIEGDLIGAFLPPVNDDYPAEIRRIMKAKFF